MLIWLTLGCI